MNICKFNHVLYDGDINIDFYLYCLKKNKYLIKYLFLNVLLFIQSLFFVKSNIYVKYKFKYLSKVNNLDKEIDLFFQNNKKVINEYLKNIDIIVVRRLGDIAICYANCDKAYKELGWRVELSLKDMVYSAYHFAKNKK